MNILITAGGNTEKIDEVRMIRNTGTGRLGALVAEIFLASDANAHIFYLCDRHAITPAGDTVGNATGGIAGNVIGDRVTVVHADDVTSLEAAVRRICAENRIDAVIHSMAVSDYRVKNVTTAMNAADAITQKGRFFLCSSEKPAPDQTDRPEKKNLAEYITSAGDVREGGKISSDLDDLLVVLERAPKIISLYRDLAPDAVIVGFKLLADVSEEELIKVGYKLLQKNDCDYVLANDTKYLRSGGHTGHLIARDGSYKTYEGKTEIAEAIAKAVASEGQKGRQKGTVHLS
jgi:phosphopantothenate-cysteine ligase